MNQHLSLRTNQLIQTGKAAFGLAATVAALVALHHPSTIVGAIALHVEKTGQGGGKNITAMSHRDKTGTNADPVNEHGSQSVENQHLTSRSSFKAEDMGIEPTTHCWASDFESSLELRLLPRYPSVTCFSSENRPASFAANQMLGPLR